MKIMGGNILNRALARVGSDTITYYKFADRVNNGAGIKVASYDPPRQLRGSVQPVARQLLAIMGLDLQRDYVTLYTQDNIEDLERNKGPDQFLYGGCRYEIVSDTDWKKPQGYVGSLAVRVV